MTDDLDLDFIRTLYPPSPPLSEPEAIRGRERARTALLAHIAVSPDSAAPPSARSRRPRPARLRLAPPVMSTRWRLTSLTVAAALIAAFVLAVSLRGGAADPASAAAAVLQKAARLAAASGGPRALRSGEYWYTKSLWTTNGVTVSDPSTPGGVAVIPAALTTTERQSWIGPDRPGVVVTRIVRPITFLTPAARRQWVRLGRPAQVPQRSRMSLPRDGFGRPYKELLALPTNVDALQRMLEREAGRGSSSWRQHEVFTEIGDLLREEPLPAPVRAALYRVAARIPGIRMLGLRRDAIGRPALAVALDDSYDGTRDELLFDPRTAALLGESTVVVKPPPAFHVPPGSSRTGSTYIRSGIVSRIGQVP